jgi:hypothetical protein
VQVVEAGNFDPMHRRAKTVKLNQSNYSDISDIRQRKAEGQPDAALGKVGPLWCGYHTEIARCEFRLRTHRMTDVG